MNIRVEGQEQPVALFRLDNFDSKAKGGQVVVRLKRVFAETLTHKFQSEVVLGGGHQLFFFSVPERMFNFYSFEWWWVMADGETLEGKGLRSGKEGAYKGADVGING